MGLLDKIEDKLTGNKSSKEEQATQSYEQNSTGSSSLRHPISSSQTSGPTTSSNVGSGREGNPNVPYDQSEYARGTQSTSHNTQTTSGLTGDRQPNIATSTNTTSATTGDRQYYDPYSRKGQQTAASAAQDYGMTPSAQPKSGMPYEDADVARSQRGGVLNNTEPQMSSHQTQAGVPSSNTYTSHTTTAQPSTTHHYGRDAGIVGGTGAAGVGAYEASKHHGTTTDSRDRYADQSSTYPTTSSSQPATTHHYGRDAGMVGGAGAAGVGAYELSKHHGTTSDSRDRYGDQPAAYSTTGGSTGGQQGYSSVAPSATQAQYADPSRRSTEGPGATSTGDESAGGLTTAKKVAAAYEAGYKDGMEHMKAEMTQKFASQQL